MPTVPFSSVGTHPRRSHRMDGLRRIDYEDAMCASRGWLLACNPYRSQPSNSHPTLHCVRLAVLGPRSDIVRVRYRLLRNTSASAGSTGYHELSGLTGSLPP
jgi:hypothetical protein